MQLINIFFLLSLVEASKYGLGGGGYYHHPIPLPVHSKHHIKTHHVKGHSYVKPVHVHVHPNAVPIYMKMDSKSSKLHVTQHHINQHGSHQQSYSKDQPHYLKHVVTKPIYQEVHEVIVPHRKVLQEIKPVQEEIKTIVAKKAYNYPYPQKHYEPQPKYHHYDKYNEYHADAGNDDGYHKKIYHDAPQMVYDDGGYHTSSPVGGVLTGGVGYIGDLSAGLAQTGDGYAYLNSEYVNELPLSEGEYLADIDGGYAELGAIPGSGGYLGSYSSEYGY